MHQQVRLITLARSCFLFLTAVVCPAGTEDARSGSVLPEPATIHVEAGLVQIPVTVTGPLGNPVTHLRQTDFEVLEDGTGRPIRHFSGEDAPVTIGIVFDASGSMRPHLREARSAVARLLRAGMEGDEYFLIAFGDRPRLMVEPVRSADQVLDKLQSIRAGGWTSLLDAAHLGLATMQRASNTRKALILLSDGADNRSRFTQLDIRTQVRESETCVYALGLFGDGQSDANIRLLADLAEATGGRMLRVASPADLPAAIEQISVSIRNQYVLGYSPVTPWDGRYRRVTVRLTRPESERLRASWRAGYYSPAPGVR